MPLLDREVTRSYSIAKSRNWYGCKVGTVEDYASLRFSFQLHSTARALWQNELLCLSRHVVVDTLASSSKVNQHVSYSYSSTTAAELQKSDKFQKVSTCSPRGKEIHDREKKGEGYSKILVD